MSISSGAPNSIILPRISVVRAMAVGAETFNSPLIVFGVPQVLLM